MANFCLPTSAVNKFTDALRTGKINPFELNKMTSEERRSLFKDIVGDEGAKQVNSEFESKMLLKNQKYAYTSWAKNVAGLKPAARTDLVAKIAKLDHALNPDEEHGFLKDLASTKLGTNVTEDEARQIVSLSKTAQDTESAAGRSTVEQAKKDGFKLSAADVEHGRARYDLERYIGELKGNPRDFKLSDFKSKSTFGSGLRKLPRAVGDVTKSIGASLDDSFALRQGVKAFWTDFPRWQKEFRGSFVNLAKAAKNSEATERELGAHLMGDPLYDQAVKDGLAIRNVKSIDDVFPTSAPGRIPVLGRAFNASEVAYSGFADNLRMGIYKNQLRLADNLGEGLSTDVRKNIAKEVNSLTGRGGFGKHEASASSLNSAFYSLRFLKSNIDTLLLHPAGVGVGGIGSAAQKTAARNLLKVIAGTAAVLGTAKALKPNSVNFNPTSANFGKIKVGNTTFEVSGGMDAIVTLASRLLTNQAESGTGSKTQLNTGKFGAPTELDYIVDFLGGKLSPVGSAAYTKFTGQTFNGGKPTIKNTLGSALVPLNVQNYAQLKADPNSANKLVAMIADTLGISTNDNVPKASNKPQFNAQVTQVLKQAGYTPSNTPTTERNVKLSKQQQATLAQKTTSLFTQAVQQAKNSSDFKSYTKTQQKESLSESLAKARSKALDQMNIKKVKSHTKVKTF